MKRLLSILCISFLLFQCKTNYTPQIQKNRIIGHVTDSAMVVSAREEASIIGVSILKKGGNAFDAMIATELALAVAYPFAGNIGGG